MAKRKVDRMAGVNDDARAKQLRAAAEIITNSMYWGDTCEGDLFWSKAYEALNEIADEIENPAKKEIAKLKATIAKAQERLAELED